jgi:hypothetical protein
VGNGISISSKLRAERTGSTAEATILGTLRGRGYTECAPGALLVAQPLLFGDSGPNLTAAKRVARQSPVGTSIYGTPLAADFIIYFVQKRESPAACGGGEARLRASCCHKPPSV